MYKIHCFFHKLAKNNKLLAISTKIDIFRQMLCAIIIASKGCDNMYSILNTNEIKEFIDKYLPMWSGSVNEITKTEYKGVYEYLVNGHYIVTVYPDHTEEFDLQ